MSVVSQNISFIRMEMSKIKAPTAHTKVYKDECVYSFDNPYCESGLYLNLLTMHGVGQRYLDVDAQRTNCKLYLLQKWKKTLKATEDVKTEAPNKLAIGTEGGFDTQDKFEVTKDHWLVLHLPSGHLSIPLPCQELPEFLTVILQACIDHEGMATNLAADSWSSNEVPPISKYADALEQVNPHGKRIPQDPKQWKDEASDATDNLWLNLSTGYIGGGRRNWDGTGGSGSAMQHFLDTGKRYPLVVKMGTITSHGADVWSYADDEDCMVTDPKLAERLSFWGIDIMRLEKTEKTVSELEVSLNLTYDWSRITDGQEKLDVLRGPGYVGLRNIGSSCYLNSAMQCFLALPEVQERYLRQHDAIVASVHGDPTEDLMLQLSKLAVGVLSERYVPPPVQEVVANTLVESVDASIPDACIVAPRMFKRIVGKNHNEFSSGRQQDVTEFWAHFLDQLSRAERTQLPRIAAAGATSTSSLFDFHVEMKFQSVQTNEVKFTKRGAQTLSNMLELPIPMNEAVPVEEEHVNQEVKRARVEGGKAEEPLMQVPFEACLKAWMGKEVVWMRHPTGQNTAFVKSTRLATFPKYLIVKMMRYYVGDNWVPKKVVAEVPVPELLDLAALRACGLREGEVLLEDLPAAPVAATVARQEETADESLVAELISMGFSENGSRRAALATHNANVEMAMNWVLEHMEDPDFNDPPAAEAARSSSAVRADAIDPDSLAMLCSMGYSEEQCRAALLATDRNIERAADWLFSRDDLDTAVAEVLHQSPKPSSSSCEEVGEEGAGSQNSQYALLAVISHIGKGTDHGHYVCHIRKDGQWALFNDDKVGKTAKAPLGHGFMYFYKRNDHN